MEQARDFIKTEKAGRVATITIDDPPRSVADHAYFGRDLWRFLNGLKLHNDRDWFLANQQRYENDVRAPFLRLIADLAPDLRKISPNFIADPSPNRGSLMRIYRGHPLFERQESIQNVRRSESGLLQPIGSRWPLRRA